MCVLRAASNAREVEELFTMVITSPVQTMTESKNQHQAIYSATTLLRRVEKVRDKMGELGLDGLLISQPHNRRYLSGFTGEDAPPLDTAGFLIIGRDDICLVTDGRYTLQAAGELPSELNIQVAQRTGK